MLLFSLSHSQSTSPKRCLFWIALQRHLSLCIYCSQMYLKYFCIFSLQHAFLQIFFFPFWFYTSFMITLPEYLLYCVFFIEHNFHLLKDVFLPLLTSFTETFNHSDCLFVPFGAFFIWWLLFADISVILNSLQCMYVANSTYLLHFLLTNNLIFV